MDPSLNNSRPRDAVPIVGIGASAGGIDALRRLFEALSPDLGAAYVVVVHLSPDRDSELPAILAGETGMPVVQVTDGTRVGIRPDHVYVIAPGSVLEISGESLAASPITQPRGRRTAVDTLFRSLATHADAVAVVLSGGGSDGVLGAGAVKEAGGFVLAQDPREAAHAGMPAAVVDAGLADLVLPVDGLAARLAELLRHRGHVTPLLAGADETGEKARDEEEGALQDIVALLRRETGHDFSRYKRATFLRRVGRRMQLAQAHRVADYLRHLKTDADEQRALFGDLLISVTAFFRDPGAWEALRTRVVHPLVERDEAPGGIRCWVAGCATGEEAYTLAMLFADEIGRSGQGKAFTIFATDIDQQALAAARAGRYPQSIVADLPPGWLERWFRPTGDDYSVVTELRDHVVFAHHSLHRDPPFSRMDLITCRNLLIYLERELQEQIVAVFRYACRDDGYLFLGASESADAAYFRPLDKHHRLWQAGELEGGRQRVLAQLPGEGPAAPPARHVVARPPRREDPAWVQPVSLEQDAPPSVLIDENGDVIYLSETAGRFFQHRGGPASRSAGELVRPELAGALAAALRHVFATQEHCLSDFVTVPVEGAPRRIAVLVKPRSDRGDGPARALVMFLDAGPPPAVGDDSAARPAGDEHIDAVLEKLRQSEQRNRRLLADAHRAEEDLRAANEELQSLNEEFRSTAEELETSKEELQSVNEELQTVNLELKSKLQEEAQAHNDLENLMSATDVATLFLDRDLLISRFTPQLAAVFKVRTLDRGRPVGDINHTLDYREFERDARAVLADLAPIERQVSSHDGHCYMLRIRPYRTSEDRIEGVVVTLVDVTGLKRVEQTLRESEARFRALVDASAQIVWTTDPSGRMTEGSASWQDFTGQTRKQAAGFGWLDAVAPDARDQVREKWRQAVASGTPFDDEMRVYHASSGRYRWTIARAVALPDEAGERRGWVGMNSDVHKRKLAVEALRESDLRKERFLATLGHELRNPLAAIRHGVEWLAQLPRQGDAAAMDSSAAEAVAIIDRQSRHMARLINDLLDFSRLSRDKLELRREPTNLQACVADVVASLRTKIEGREIEVDLQLPGTPLVLDADPDRLAQIIANLVHNAVNFTKPGGNIWVAARQCDGHARITVRDNGIGIDPEQLPTLFEPYRQAGSDSPGLGLGLAVIKRLVELHGGHVTGKSPGRDQGSEFEVTLPLGTRPAADGDAAPAAGPAPRHRVLVVDDESDVADMFAGLLRGLGQDVNVAYDAASALRAATARRPQVAFLDLAMPGMGGVDLSRRLRERFPEEELVLIALSGHDEHAAVARGGQFQHHLLKPASVGAVRDLLCSLG